ncbi:MAG: nucleoside phosphorylase [Bacteroidaceae bacterium]|nr:nucleoside phosphorylase [Bacteroidaceae bacterium]
MEKKYIAPSELPINEDGSVFHLHVKPEQLADKVILVGDLGRVPTIASHFEKIECDIHNREFRTITGTYQGKRITCTSTGIGCDNIDIVMTELDALANVDFDTREVKESLRQLEIVRIGTSGGLQRNTPIGTFVCSERSIGFDGVVNFYAKRNQICDLAMERAFVNHMGWCGTLGAPAAYAVHADEELVNRIAGSDMMRGITIAANGFYGPQGRTVRLEVADPHQNEKIERFEFDGLRITNFEMESSALAGLAKMMGHRATTACLIIANRLVKEMDTGYKNTIDGLIKTVLDRI